MKKAKGEEIEEASEAPPLPSELPIETWAERKGMLPMYRQTSMGDRINPSYWKFSAAKVSLEWHDGQHVTEEAFDAAVAALDGHRFG